MAINKELLIELVELLDQFESESNGADGKTKLQDFVGFLNAKLNNQAFHMRKIGGDEHGEIQTVREESNSDISILITLMFRYAKSYIKKALQDSLIQTADEFVYLINLMTHTSLTKSELINKQVMEKTSGVEVIKRLRVQKLVNEFADPEDKRSVRVAITESGKQEIMKILPQMAMVSKIVVGNLTQTEINTLSYLLKKLDHYHNDIFLHKKNASLHDILSQSNN